MKGLVDLKKIISVPQISQKELKKICLSLKKPNKTQKKIFLSLKGHVKLKKIILTFGGVEKNSRKISQEDWWNS